MGNGTERGSAGLNRPMMRGGEVDPALPRSVLLLDARVDGYPVHFPRLAAIVREGLFESNRIL